MSGTLQASIVKDSASATNNLALDASGNVTVGNNLTVSGTGNTSFSGNVGIGTNSPANKFNVVDANTSGDDNIGNVYIRTTDSYASANVGGKLTLGGFYNATSNYAFAGIAGRKENATLNNVAGYLQFLTTTSGGALTERMRIDSTGNVGIGTTSPNVKFEVVSGPPNTVLRSTVSTSYASLRLYNDQNSALRSLEIDYAGSAYSGPLITGGPSGESAVITTTGAYPLVFGTSNTARAMIDSSGNLLVGTTNASGTAGEGLKILDTGRAATTVASYTTSANSNWIMYSTGAGAYRFFVGWGGSVNATSTSITAISDQSLKTNIRPLETGITEIMRLKPRRFDWKEETQIGETNVAGFIAQEVQEVLPELVYDYKYTDTETKLGLKMGDMLPTVVKALQEAVDKITALEDRITKLESGI